MSNTTWDFRGGNVPGSWKVTHLTEAAPSDAGLRLRADRDGSIMTIPVLDHDSQAVALHVLSPRNADIILLWHRRGTPEKEIVQLPVNITGSPEEQKIEISLARYGQWDERPDRFGIGLKAKTEITVGAIELLGWNIFEKFVEAVKSFWNFDDLNPYSINFLWGPILNFNPIARQQQFTMLPPPVGWSFNKVMIPTLAVAGGILGFLAWRGSAPRRRTMAIFAVSIFAGAWLLWDMRMGLEFLHYAKQDAERFVLRPIGKRSFRTNLEFRDVVESSMPFLIRSKRYAFLSPPSLPFESIMRYLTYPSLPSREGEGLKDVDVWLTFLMPEVTVNETGQLMMNDLVLSKTGHIIRRFVDGSFLFTTATGSLFPETIP